MSHPGIPGESFVRDRMAAGRGAAANPIDPEILELAEGGGGTQTASAAPSPSGAGKPSSAGASAENDAPRSQPDLPLGQRVAQVLSSAAASAGKVVKDDVGASWDKLKGDFIESTGLSADAKKAFQEGSFWDQMKSQFHSTVAAGKLPLDAFNLALSPLNGAIDAGADAASKAVFSALPEVPGYGQKELRAALNTAAQLMAPAKGKVPVEGVGAPPKDAPKPSAAAENVKATANPELSGDGLKPVADGPAYHEMSLEDIDQHIQWTQESDQQKLVRALGEDGAKEFKRLDRARNSTMDTARADAASKEFDRRFGNLTPEQERLVYGIGEDKELAVDELKQIRRAREFADFVGEETDAELGRSLSRAMLDIKPNEVRDVFAGESVSGDKIASAIKAKAALEEIVSRRGSFEAAKPLIADAMKARGYSAGDAGEVLQDWGVLSKRSVGRPALSGVGPENRASAEAAPPPFTIAGEAAPAAGAKLKITQEVRDQAEAFLRGKRGDNPIQVSLEALSRDPDLNKTVSDVARMIPKGKVKPDDIRQMNAYSLNLQPDELMARMVPDIPSDEIQAAGAMLVNSAGRELQNFAKAAMENPTPEAREAAVRAYAQTNEIIGRFRDSGTDLGRGLRARQAAQDTNDAMGKAIHQVIADVGPENVDEAIRKIAALPEPKTVSPFVSSLRWMGGRDGLLYGWYNWLLSNPRTLVSNVASNTGASAWNVAVRYVAEKFGTSGDIRPGEAAALLQGYTGSIRDGLKAAATALKAGKSQFFGDYTTMDGRVISATDHHSPTPLADGDITSGALQYLRAALPTSWIGAADDFAKVVNYRAEARALLHRDGMIKGLSNDEMAAHVERSMANMPEHLHVQAKNAALRNTFQEPLTGIAESLQTMVDKANVPIPGTGLEVPLGRILMPFVKTPANLARFAYHNSGLAYALPSQRIREELAAGGATRDLALARMGLGTAVSVTAMPFMAMGMLSGRGPSDPQMNRAWRDAGNQPYSIRVGDTWYGYNKVDPLGLHLGALADTIETMKFAHDEDAEQLAWSAVFGMGDAMLSKTYMQGMSDFLEALHDPQGEGKRYGDRLISAMTMPSGAAALAMSSDPWMRQHYDLLSSIHARTPGLAASLPPVRDLWGQPVPASKGFLPPVSGTALADLLSPVKMGPAENAQPIDKWIWENRAAFPDADNGRLGLSRPGQVQSFDVGPVSAQVKLTDRQLDRLRALTGNEMKDPSTGLGARDALNALVDGKYPGATQGQWDKASPSARAVMVLRIWNKYRTAAKQQLLADSPALQETVGAKANSRVEALRAPNMEISP